VYGTLALYGETQPFYQFDARLGWVCMPLLRAGVSWQSEQSPLYIQQYTDNGQYAILMHPIHNYIDYTEADQLEFPEPPPDRGVIVSGKLPLWLFTALARFYAHRNVPWIALNDARNNQAVVIYSRVEAYSLGAALLMPV
jgi:CRISPR-associated protein Csx3